MNQFEWEVRAQKELSIISGQPMYDWSKVANHLHKHYVILDDANDEFESYAFHPEDAMKDQLSSGKLNISAYELNMIYESIIPKNKKIGPIKRFVEFFKFIFK